MGLLDDLENEAQKRRTDDENAAARKVERESSYRTVFEPALVRLNGYLGELASKLKELNPKIAMRYTIAGYGDVIGYIEHEYDIREAKQASSREVSISFASSVASSECPSVQVEGANRVRAIAALFQRYRLGAPLAAAKDASGEVASATFKAKGRIPLEARMSSDTTSGHLRLAFTNFDGLGTVVKLVPAERVNDDLFDEIGRYLMREPNDLMREALSDDYRDALRARVREQEVRRRWESQITARQIEGIAMLKREYSMGGRFSRIGDAVGKLKGLVARKS